MDKYYYAYAHNSQWLDYYRSLTRQGKSIVCTIHQPSSEVFELFDRVLLMAEGNMAYLGDIERCYDFFSE